MPRFSIHTLGCRANQADSERLREILISAGFEQVDFGMPADCQVVNTCTVTREADRKSRQMIRRALRGGGQVVATGCAVADRGGVQRLPGAALRLPPDRRDDILALVGAGRCPDTELVETEVGQARTRALLKIQDGCDQFCSFCIVPYVRGRGRSLSQDQVIVQARRLEAQGFREVVLTGIHLATWGHDLPGAPDLSHLLGALVEQTGVRIRLSSVEPDHFPLGLLELMAVRPDRICPHLHLVLQHASDAVLARMRRGYDLAHYETIARRFVETVQGACLTSDIMVGFPGETEEDFRILLDYIGRTPFYRLHVFPYSLRPGTSASKFPDQVPAEVKTRRRDRLLRLAERKRVAYLRSQYGALRRVLVERTDGPGWVHGVAENYVGVRLRGGPPLVGRTVPVRVLRRRGDSLVGRPEGQDFPEFS